MAGAPGRGTCLQQMELVLLQGFFNFKQPEVKATLGKYVPEKRGLQGSKEKKVCSCVEREDLGERHQRSRGQMRENQQDGKKETRTSEKKAGENKSLEVHKIAGKKENNLGDMREEKKCFK